jgi:cold shock protein
VTVLSPPRPAFGRATDQDDQPPDGDEDLVDFLSEAEFLQAVTEALLVGAPQLTGEQIQRLRMVLLRFGRDHGWVE